MTIDDINLKEQENSKYSISFFRDLFLGFIYAGVLGNILYLVFTIIFQFEDYLLIRDFYPKFSILLITLVFYVCDYFYLYFTYNAKKWMFLLNFLFVIILFFTIHTLHIPSLPESNNSKFNNVDISPYLDMHSILLAYLFFMVLYYVWDTKELENSTSSKEQSLLRFIIWWERFAAFFIGLSLFINDTYFSISVLALITIFFCGINYRKYQLWLLYNIVIEKNKK